MTAPGRRPHPVVVALAVLTSVVGLVGLTTTAIVVVLLLAYDAPVALVLVPIGVLTLAGVRALVAAYDRDRGRG